jgi:hypothetical protein
VQIRVTFAPGLWHVIPTFTLNCAAFVQKRAIAVPVSAKNMITTTVNDALRLAAAALNPAVKWQWLNRPAAQLGLFLKSRYSLAAF